MKIDLGTSGLFSKIIDSLSKVLDVVALKVSTKALSIKGMDASHVAMVDLFYPNELAEKYEVKAARELRFSVIDMNRYLKRTKIGEGITILFDQPTNKLIIRVKGQKRNRTYKLGLLIEDEEEEIPSPKLDLKNKLILDASEFKEGIKDCEVGEYTNFTIDGDQFILSASGDSGDVEVQYPKEAMEAGAWAVKDTKAISMYSLEYLTDFVSVLVANKVQVEFSTEMPVQLRFDLDKGGYLQFLLAPRVEEDEAEYDDVGAEEDTEEEGEDKPAKKKKTTSKTTKKGAKKKKQKEEPEEEEEEESEEEEPEEEEEEE